MREGVETLGQSNIIFIVVESESVVVRAVRQAQAERVEGGHPPQDPGQVILSDRIVTTSFCILPLLLLNPQWLTLHPSTFTSESPMAYPACGGEYYFVGDGEVGDCPRPLEGRQLTVDFVEPFLLHFDVEFLLFLALAAVVADWL